MAPLKTRHSGDMTKRTALVSVMLLAGLVAAVTGVTAALRFVGGGAFGPGGQPLTPADVQQSLAQHPQAQSRQSTAVRPTHRPTASPARSSGPARAPVSGSFASSGGNVTATCLSGQVRLKSWSPAQGYATDGYSRGPASSAWVKFKSSATELTVTAICTGGQPQFTTAADNGGGGAGGGGVDDHGGGGGHGGGGSGSGHGGS
jgi:hypothetical protein